MHESVEAQFTVCVSKVSISFAGDCIVVCFLTLVDRDYYILDGYACIRLYEKPLEKQGCTISNNNCYLLMNSVLCIPRLARSPFPRPLPLTHLLPFKHRLTRTYCTHRNERNSVLFWPVPEMEGWGSDKVCVLQKVFHVAVSGCPPPALGHGAAWGPPGPQGQPVPFPSHPERTSSQGQMWQLAQPPWRSRSKETMSNLPPTIIF